MRFLLPLLCTFISLRRQLRLQPGFALQRERALANCQATRVSQTKLGLRLQIKCIARVSPYLPPSPLLPFPPATHLNCINNVQSKKFNDCRCRHLSLLAQRCLRPRPPHQSSATRTRTHKLDRWRVKFMGRRQSDRNLSLNAVHLNNVAPTAMDAACRHATDAQRQRGLHRLQPSHSCSRTCNLHLAVSAAAAAAAASNKEQISLAGQYFERPASVCRSVLVRLSAHAACQHASSCGLWAVPVARGVCAMCVCAPDTADKSPSAAVNLTTVK